MVRKILARGACIGVAALSLCASAAPAHAADCELGLLANLPVTMQGLRATVPIKINGQSTTFWLDSGAFFNTMPAAKAAEFGLPMRDAPEGFYLIGIGGTASVRLTTAKSFGIVGQELKNVDFIVGGSDSGSGLIGRNLLGVFDTEFDLASGSVKLIKPRGCATGALAYWAGTKPYFSVPLETGPNHHDHLFRLPVAINGAQIHADIDTGSPFSLISRHAAEKAGIDLSGPGVIPQSGIGGLGRHFERGWVVPVDSVAIGDEQILKTHLMVIDGEIAPGANAGDMLLGADFVLAHHIYVARGQGRIYFTYSGGKAFLAPGVSEKRPADTQSATVPEGLHRVEAFTPDGAAPKTAEEYARRGNARLSQQAFSGAIDDLSKAIGLSPKTSDYYRDRSRAYAESGRIDLARTDLAKAIELDPNNAQLLLERGFLRLQEKDHAGALSDAEAAARSTPPSSLASVQVAVLFERLHQPARAITIFDGVIAVHRDDSQLGGLLNARCWERALADVQLDQALDDCNRAIKRDGERPAYLDSRGLVHFRQGNLLAAITDYDAALKQNPKLAWSLYVRGLAKIGQGQADAGKADQAAAAAIEPDIAETAAAYGIGH